MIPDQGWPHKAKPKKGRMQRVRFTVSRLYHAEDFQELFSIGPLIVLTKVREVTLTIDLLWAKAVRWCSGIRNTLIKSTNGVY